VKTINRSAGTYAKEFGAAMLGYAIILPLSIWLVQWLRDSPWRYPAALLPIAPSALAMVAFLRFLRRMDELQQRIQIEAIGIAFGATALLTFSYGFLENAGLPRLSWTWILPLMIVIWGVATAYSSHRYS
jgi:hypothetical protein